MGCGFPDGPASSAWALRRGKSFLGPVTPHLSFGPLSQTSTPAPRPAHPSRVIQPVPSPLPSPGRPPRRRQIGLGLQPQRSREEESGPDVSAAQAWGQPWFSHSPSALDKPLASLSLYFSTCEMGMCCLNERWVSEQIQYRGHLNAHTCAWPEFLSLLQPPSSQGGHCALPPGDQMLFAPVCCMNDPFPLFWLWL